MTKTRVNQTLTVGLLDKGVKGLSKSIYNEANLPELLMIQQVAAIKDESGLHHSTVDSLVVILLELIPLSEYSQTVCIIAGLIWVC